MCFSIRFCDLLFVYGSAACWSWNPLICAVIAHCWSLEPLICLVNLNFAYGLYFQHLNTGSAILDLKLSTSMVIFMALDAALRLMVLELEPQSSAITCRVVAIAFDSYVHNARYYLATFINSIFGYLQSTCFVVVIVVLCCAAEQFCSMIKYHCIFIIIHHICHCHLLREQLYLVVQDADFAVLKEDWGMTQHPPQKENKSSYHEVLVIALRLVVVVKKGKRKAKKGARKTNKVKKKQEDSNSRKREQRRR